MSNVNNKLNDKNKEKLIIDNFLFGLEILIKELNKYNITNFRLESKTLYYNIISNMKTSIQLIKKYKIDAFHSVMRSTLESFYYLIALENDEKLKIGMNTRIVNIQNKVEEIIINQKIPDYMIFKSLTENSNKTDNYKIDINYYYEDLCKVCHVTPKKLENIEIERSKKEFKRIYAIFKLDIVLYLITYMFKFTDIKTYNEKLIKEVFRYVDIMFSTIYLILIKEIPNHEWKFLYLIKDKYTIKYKENFEITSTSIKIENDLLLKNFIEKKLKYQLGQNGYLKKYNKINISIKRI